VAKATYKNPTAGLSLDQVEDLHRETLGRLSHGYRLPFMQWFEDDFRGSEGVEEMDALERLMYRQLLAKAWASKDAPYLPTDQDRLRRLCDCPSEDLWTKHRKNVLLMFRESKHEGKMFHPRQLLDYVGQLTKVSANTENGGKGGRPKNPIITEAKPNHNPSQTERLFSDNPNETQPKPIKNQNENQTKNEELEKESDVFPQPSKTEIKTDMKAKTEMQVLTLRITGTPAENYKWNEVTILERAFGSATVVTDYEAWLTENEFEDFRGKPVSAYLKIAPERLVRENLSEVDNSAVVALSRDIAYVTDNVINCKEKEKAGLSSLLSEYSHEEIVAAARRFDQELNKDNAKNVDFATKNFIEGADNMLSTARRKKQEKDLEASAVAQAAARMQEEAEAERKARREAQAKEEALVEDELGD